MPGVIDGDSWGSAAPDLLQRAAHLAVLRILAGERQEELDRLAADADVLVRIGYTLDRQDARARLDHARRTARMSRRLAAAAAELSAAEAALRAAILDDAWCPSDDLGGPEPLR
jgi:hypothetical protein